ncbi:AAA family ATPase (plasmid) [Lichenicola cladoniae]|uniref:AAA family ATPase n=1 Tax=Lichenicola cladoniae TaxID=1484109 RepID=A0A6M8I0Q3_9PROT|nr:AAA family ATPase [Lichenicola cladoniae]NPD69786.1 AAA family ATPase [Acetobacteraceae bacterium]QKE94018.1 AAA family ATPase [Lichenicola cladoniae]
MTAEGIIQKKRQAFLRLTNGLEMKINNLLVTNFRGIQRVEAEGLGDTIIIAGQNGSGKSCIFDAIRLLKSTYGGYQQNEWQNFFGEFQIQLHGGAKNLQGLFNDATKTVVIKVDFELRDSEKLYISTNAKTLVEETIWQSILPEAFQYGGWHKALFAAQFREKQPEVDKKVADLLPSVQTALSKKDISGKIEIKIDGQVAIQDSVLLNLIFSTYRPRDIGVIDFHGAQRHYGRESVQGINLNLDQAKQTYSQSTLYNYNAKYNNVKSEMAGSFIRELLAEQAGLKNVSDGEYSLNKTLKELFDSFFPDKTFLGPRPTKDGSLAFPVMTQNGTEHDLDELSSGEKEILYGYLRIRSSAPKDSIILLDEPELHLNPRLIRGLPEFYRKYLGEALQNQLWLVTHSDALIREAVGKPGFNVFHMLPCGAEVTGTSQLRPLNVTADLDLAIADLVGDLAAYRPGGKGLIFEGGGDSDFDKTITGSLFAEELRGINLISGTNKARVQALHEILARAYANGDLPTKFYAVTDSDADDPSVQTPGVNRFSWDVYHLENYLLEDSIIADVLNSLRLQKEYDAKTVGDRLVLAAQNVVPSMLVQKMKAYANSKLVDCIKLGFDPATLTIGNDLSEASNRSADKMRQVVLSDLSKERLNEVEQTFRSDIQQSFATGSWRKKLPGREILKQFVQLENLQGYELVRNLIVSRMTEKGVKPAGMKVIIDQIVAD